MHFRELGADGWTCSRSGETLPRTILYSLTDDVSKHQLNGYPGYSESVDDGLISDRNDNRMLLRKASVFYFKVKHGRR